MTVASDWSVVNGPPFLMSGAPNQLPSVTTSQSTTRIRFPAPGVIPDRNGKAERAEDSGHTSTFGVVYANDIAGPSMLSKEIVKFPVGSVIVREKLASTSAINPDILAVMIKRGAGFNRKAGDWDI